MNRPSETSYLVVKLTPRSPRDEIGGWRDGVLQARVKASPVDGKANEALCALVAGALRVPGRDVTLVSGRASRTKRLRIDGVAQDEVALRLGAR